jgi:mycothiol synthase
MPPPVIHSVPASEARRVLRFTLAVPGQSSADLERQVSTFIEYARAMRLDLGRQWQMDDDGRPVAALSVIESPGRTAVLFLRDGRLTDAGAAVRDALLRRAVAEESHRDVRLLQCLVGLDDHANQSALLAAGFIDIAILVYMERAMAETPPPAPATIPPALQADRLEWLTYDADRRRLFVELIAATYRDSLDCPRLTGLRTLDDILIGHQSVGRFKAHRWLMLTRLGRPAGCILLVESPLRSALELTYMGVHPDHRRLGLARVLLAQGLHLAQAEGFSFVTLAVDEANDPARRAYAAFDFVETARRRAFVLPLRPTPTAP